MTDTSKSLERSGRRAWPCRTPQAAVAQPGAPGLAHVRRQPHLVPHFQEPVEVDVEAHVVVEALSHHPRVAGPQILAVIEVVAVGEAPGDMARQGDPAAGC